MALNDVYELKLSQTMLAQQCEAVFFYQQQDLAVVTIPPSENNAAALASWWEDEILPDILLAQSPSVSNLSIAVRNLFDAADASTVILTGTGTGGVGGDPMPPFNTFDFVLAGVGSAVKNGRKRLAGVNEGGQASGVVVDAASQYLALDNASTAMETKWMSISGLATLFAPVVVKRVKEIVDGEPRYRLPEVAGELVLKVIADVVWKTIVAHQVSRSFGRGI